mmetsp:Transcript_5428/g.6940  ORF Transcript_5428/g.6940 Transcript_5428/m.6940 type:complete len:102 (+) Transcript_5428:1-306(+)
MAEGYEGGKKPSGGKGNALDTNVVNVDHCHDLTRKWHSVRADLENQLFQLTKDSSIQDGTNGTYMQDIFHGHCKADGNEHYLLLSGSDDTFDKINGLYLNN